MRYIGSKGALTDKIINLLGNHGLLKKDLVFCDAFCGMGSVASALKPVYKHIIINDSLTSAVTYTKGLLVSDSCAFRGLDVNPFVFLNETKTIEEGFIYKNYSPGQSSRMYFTTTNAGRIDFFRSTIEDWYKVGKISDHEYSYLLACLLESVSMVANTAGVYGAFLKHWDNRALKDIEFCEIKTPYGTPMVEDYNSRIEEIIDKIDCDVLYLDPPYTQNQYGTQYHLLETIVLNDNPKISPITGSRPTTPMRSMWSKNYHSHILLDYVIAKTKAKHIILSYNNDGFMSKEFIENVLKRYGKEETYKFECIEYKKYKNFKCRSNSQHKEYLFYIEKKEDGDIVYESPLNYTGSKFKMASFIKKQFPKNNIDIFVDLFGGGFNIGINATANKIIYNDINPFVKDLICSFKSDTYEYLQYIGRMTQKYHLSPDDKNGFLSLRTKYNELPPNKRDVRMLYTLILHGFQQQIRFNSDWGFNNPHGSRRFNEKLLAKFVSFSRHIQEIDTTFINESFDKVSINPSETVLVYADPPYRATVGVYNDGKRGFEGWTRTHEKNLCNYLDLLDSQGTRFILSYLIRTEDFYNEEIVDWVKSNGYRIIDIPFQGRYNKREEVLIMNY